MQEASVVPIANLKINSEEKGERISRFSMAFSIGVIQLVLSHYFYVLDMLIRAKDYIKACRVTNIKYITMSPSINLPCHNLVHKLYGPRLPTNETCRTSGTPSSSNFPKPRCSSYSHMPHSIIIDLLTIVSSSTMHVWKEVRSSVSVVPNAVQLCRT